MRRFHFWHAASREGRWNDGCSEHGICRICGISVMRDSQGNWFPALIEPEDE